MGRPLGSSWMLLWLLLTGKLQARVASSFNGFWDGFENHDAFKSQHLSSDQSESEVEFYQPSSYKSQSQGSKSNQDLCLQRTSGESNSLEPCIKSKPQQPSSWPYPGPKESGPIPQSPYMPDDTLRPVQQPRVPDNPLKRPNPKAHHYISHLWQYPGFQQPANQPRPGPYTTPPPYQPTPVLQTTQSSKRRTPGPQTQSPSKGPQEPDPLPHLPSRLFRPWYQQNPQRQSQSSSYLFKPLPPWPKQSSNVLQVSSPQPQPTTRLFHPLYQQRPQNPLENQPKPHPAKYQPGNQHNAPGSHAEPQMKLPRPLYQQRIQHYSQSYLIQPPPVTQEPAPPSNLPHSPPSPQQPALPSNLLQEPQLTPATLQSGLSSDPSQAQPSSKLSYPWYQQQPQSQFPIQPQNPQAQQIAIPSNLPQPSPAPQQSAKPSNLLHPPGPEAHLPSRLQYPWYQPDPQHQLGSYIPQSHPWSQVPHVHNNLAHLPSIMPGPQEHPPRRLSHPWYQEHNQQQLPSYMLKPQLHPWLQLPPYRNLPLRPSLQGQTVSRPIYPWYQQRPEHMRRNVPNAWSQHWSQHWPQLHRYPLQPASYWPWYSPHGPSNQPNAWSQYISQWPVYSPWPNYVPPLPSCKPPLLCFELNSNAGFYPSLPNEWSATSDADPPWSSVNRAQLRSGTEGSTGPVRQNLLQGFRDPGPWGLRGFYN